MSSTARIRDGGAARLARSRGAKSPAKDAQPSSPGTTPRRLLWSVGVAGFVLGIIAFVLWGINGAGTLFDMIAAFCG
jgi:hypothetical protein